MRALLRTLRLHVHAAVDVGAFLRGGIAQVEPALFSPHSAGALWVGGACILGLHVPIVSAEVVAVAAVPG